MRIVYQNNDDKDGGENSVAVIVPSPRWSGTIEELAAKVVPDGKAYKIVEDSAVSTDRTFRDAWENYEDITVSLPKAKEITKKRLRRERKPLLEEQDILFMRAVETSQDKSEIVTEKQRLRDITVLADDATTLDELKGLQAS
jgi:hypothetical protein